MAHRHRIVASHWDSEDEFINLSITLPAEDDSEAATYWSESVITIRHGAALVGFCGLIFLLHWFFRRQRFSRSKDYLDRIYTTTKDLVLHKLFATQRNLSTFFLAVRDMTMFDQNGKADTELVSDDKPAKEDVLQDSNEPLEGSSLNLTGERNVVLAGPLSFQENLVNEANDFAQALQTTETVFVQNGVNPQLAHSYVLQRQLSHLQEQSRREQEDKRMGLEFQLRRMEHMSAERRHEEQLDAQTNNWHDKLSKGTRRRTFESLSGAFLSQLSSGVEKRPRRQVGSNS